MNHFLNAHSLSGVCIVFPDFHDSKAMIPQKR